MPAQPANRARQKHSSGDCMFKRFVRNLILREKSDSEKYVAFLRNKGVQIGENVKIFSPTKCVIDITCPWLLTIGNNVNITYGVIVLTHDYSWSVLKVKDDEPGRILGAQSPTNIGNNVFIGMNSVITKGADIGDNVIIGAGSVVSGKCESNSVYAGVPAKKIMTIDEYYKKREAAQFEDAKKMVLAYREKFNQNPPIDVFYEYFMLFCSAEEACDIPAFKKQLEVCGNFDESIAYMNNHKPMFNSYNDFLKSCISG